MKYIRCPICTTLQPYEVDFCVYCNTDFDKTSLMPIERDNDMKFDEITKNLEMLGYKVSCFETAKEAADYLDSQIDGVTVGMGGSMTLDELGIFDRLKSHNEVYWHQKMPREVLKDAAGTDIYISSVNGIAKTGEIVNIDGNCNRVASTMYGHKKVYLVAGSNKIEDSVEQAIWRARNVAAPLNARRLGKKTPCATGELKCHNCKSPERICRALSVFYTKPNGCDYEIVLIAKKLGY